MDRVGDKSLQLGLGLGLGQKVVIRLGQGSDLEHLSKISDQVRKG